MWCSSGRRYSYDGEGRRTQEHRVVVLRAHGNKCLLDALLSNIPPVAPGMHRMRNSLTCDVFNSNGVAEAFDVEVTYDRPN